MGKRNRKIEFLLSQPIVGKLMETVNAADVLSESKAKRAFFVETFFGPVRPSFFKSREFEERYGMKLFPNNLEYYAESLEKVFGEGSFSKEDVRHKEKYWVNNLAFNDKVAAVYCLLYALKHEKRFGKFDPKTVAGCKEILFKEVLKNLDLAFVFLTASFSSIGSMASLRDPFDKALGPDKALLKKAQVIANKS